jgi:hypothetical protein
MILPMNNVKPFRSLWLPILNFIQVYVLVQKNKNNMSRIPYANAVESIMYVMVSTRPDISHAVGVVSRYMKNPGKEH